MQTHQNFYKIALNIAAPIAIQNFIMSGLNLIDTLMIGGLGEDAIAAVGVANRLFFFFIVSVFGIYSGCGIYTSQYWGKRDILSIHKVMGIMLTLGSVFSIVFIMVSLIFPERYMMLFSSDSNVVLLGVSYLKIVAPSFLLTAVSFMYAYTSRSIHLTKYPMYISAFALSINTLLNYIFIYGRFGVPKMGVVGAAIATSISRTIELFCFLLLIYYFKDHPLRANLRTMFSFNKHMFTNVIKKGLPVFINESSWSLGTTIYFIAFGLLGKSALAVVQVGLAFTDIFVAFFVGISSACGVMIGNALGNHDYVQAEEHAKKFIKITIVLAALVMVLLMGMAYVIPSFYSAFSATSKTALTYTIVVMAFYQIPKMYNFTAIVGILRSGGDTVFCMLLDGIGVWAIGIPLAFISAYFFDFPVYIVVGIAYIEEIVKCCFATMRIKSKKWLQNIVDDLSQ